MSGDRSRRPFDVYVAAAVVGIAAYFLLPSAAQNIAFIVSNLVACSTIVVSWRRRRLTPTSGWLLIAAFSAAAAVGNTVYLVNDSILHVEPFPSPGDAAFLGGYVLLAAGLLRLQHARTTGRDLPAVLDTAIVTIGFAAASWVVFMAPLLGDDSAGLIERVTAVGYPVADVLVVAVAARFFLTSGRRSPAVARLAGTVVVMLVADTVFAVLNLLGQYHTGHPLDALLLAYYLGWGAVALHPRAAELAVGGDASRSRPSWWRLAALTTASLVAPATVIVQIVSGSMDDVLVTASASAVLFLLVVGRIVGLVRVLESVLAQRRALESQLEHNAHHDDLTGLANRRRFTDLVETSLERHPDGGTCVLFLDLDRFKNVNDSLGHAAGDTLLTVTASRLRAVLRPQDTIARLGGDEFAVLLDACPSAQELSDDCLALSAALTQPVELHGLDVNVSASIGAAHAQPGDTFEDLMHRADTAMYAQKSRSERRANSARRPTGAVHRMS